MEKKKMSKSEWVLTVLGVFGIFYFGACVADAAKEVERENNRYTYSYYYNSGSKSSYSSSSSSGGSKSSTTGSSSSNRTGSAGKKSTYSSSYDDGYNDIYDDGDYDWNRYQRDRDYANGVDDAMDDDDW